MVGRFEIEIEGQPKCLNWGFGNTHYTYLNLTHHPARHTELHPLLPLTGVLRLLLHLLRDAPHLVMVQALHSHPPLADTLSTNNILCYEWQTFGAQFRWWNCVHARSKGWKVPRNSIVKNEEQKVNWNSEFFNLPMYFLCFHIFKKMWYSCQPEMKIQLMLFCLKKIGFP